MYHHIRGSLLEINPTFAVVESAGIGYTVHVSLPTFTAINGQKEVMLYLYPVFKEDAINLFGFSDRSEREVFQYLIAVSGVGGNTARLILSSLSVEEVREAILDGNAKTLQSVKGVGGKTAQRIIIDLKDKIGGGASVAGSAGSGGSKLDEALSALETLGYPTKQADRILRMVYKEDPTASVEELIKNALKKL